MDRIVSIYSLSTVSNLSVLVVAEPDFQWNSNFNGIQYWRHQRFCRIIFNVDFFLLSLLHYLLQDLIFIANPNRVRCFLDFQGSMVTLRSPSDSNLQHCLLWLPTAHKSPKKIMNEMMFLSLSRLHITYIALMIAGKMQCFYWCATYLHVLN
jgi:hypothetical protein